MSTEADAIKGGKERKRFRWELTILITMYLGYVAFMLCRNTLIAASPAMIEDPSLGLDKAKFGRLMSWHSAGAIAGKLVTGVGADLIGGRKMFLLALSLTAASTAAFGMVSSLSFFAGLNFLGQFFKSGGWPAMAKIIGAWYSSHKYGRVWSIISTSSRVGTITAGVLFGALLTLVSWRVVFFVSAGLTAAIVSVGYIWLKNRPKDVGLAPPLDGQSPTEQMPHLLDGSTLAQACFVFAQSWRVWLICFALAFLTILMDFINFIPIYLNETLALGPGRASMAGSAFPAGMFFALIVTGAVYDQLSKSQLVWVLGLLLGLSCLCVLFLWQMPLLSLPPALTLPAAMGSIFLFGFSISPAYYVPMSVFSIAFGGKHSGFLIALIDVCGYSGAFVFNFFGGSIAQTYGWTVFLSLLLVVTVLAMITMTVFLHLDRMFEERPK